jgi:hypothetical protein
MSAQSGTTYGDRVLFRGEDGEGPGGELYGVTRHFTDAQIKAWPTTALEVLPAPPAGVTWIVLDAVVMLDSTDGAYTNLDTNAYLALDVYGGDYLFNDPSEGVADCDAFLGVAGHQLVRFQGRARTEIQSASSPPAELVDFQTNQWGVRPLVVASFTDREGAPVCLTLDNGASGNLTGGHGQNSLLVRTLAMRVPSPSRWATQYPVT